MRLSFIPAVFLIQATCSAIIQFPATVHSATTVPRTGINATSLSPSPNSCNGWIENSDSCYYIFNTFEYFSVAKQLCEKQGATLASISSQKENDFIFSLVKKSTRYSEAWLGLKYNTKKLRYEWLDRTVTKYKNWLYGKPGQEGYCVEMIPGGKWNNLLCNNRLQYICEKPKKKILQDNKLLKTIILVSIPLSCIFLMSTFVAYLWFRSVRQLSSALGKENSCDSTEITKSMTSLTDPVPISQRTIINETEVLDGSDQIGVQSSSDQSFETIPNFTRVCCNDGVYRTVTLV